MFTFPCCNHHFCRQFSSVQLEFQSLAETIIIMLHLEVRCHCFYYLLPALQKVSNATHTPCPHILFPFQSSYVLDQGGVEEDSAVQQLAKDLKNIDLVMVAVLSQDKYRYLFDGLGHLVASIFISSMRHIKTINSNGIKKM